VRVDYLGWQVLVYDRSMVENCDFVWCEWMNEHGMEEQHLFIFDSTVWDWFCGRNQWKVSPWKEVEEESDYANPNVVSKTLFTI